MTLLAFRDKKSVLPQVWAVAFPDVSGHPNRLPFEGCLTRVDEPSVKAPSGARSHRVVLTRAAAVEAMPSLLGMAVNFAPGWDTHGYRNKCGIITTASLEKRRLMVGGYIFAREFPEVQAKAGQSEDATELGMSYELADAHVSDMRASVWTLNQVTFTGAAILLRKESAYKSGTSFWIPEARA